VNVAAPISMKRPTRPTSAIFRASSMSSKATEPISRPAPSAMTIAMNRRLGEAT
jgi:hypothetical protein